MADASAWTRPRAQATYPEALLSAGEDPTSPRVMNRGVTLVLGAVLGYLALYFAGSHAVAGLGWLVEGRPGSYSSFYDHAVRGFGSPWGIWAAHVGLALLVVLAWAAYRFFIRRRMAWFWSVMPGVRWRYGIAALLVAAAVFGGYAGASFALGPGWDPPAGWGWYLLAIVVTSPLQALGEEVLFRGYLMQAFGLIMRRPWFPIVSSAAVFALFHGAQDMWLFLSRFAFGLLAGTLVWLTGGLEAGIAAHALNNLCAFGLALSSGGLTETRTVTSITPLVALADVGLFAIFALAAWGVARAMRVPRRAPAL
ncbi:MAG: CPBP family intramembrane metalloprotease [Propionibacteriaceae bacterium]|jgi:membrane protease YdiL (CAAX protease family)|nr:CPBP family intramembrane metalloprotease [Propionibacteriaceae bacterium]